MRSPRHRNHRPGTQGEVVNKKGALSMGAALSGAGAALGAGAASMCCVGPLAVSILGVGGAVAAAGLRPYRLYLLVGSFLLIGYGFWDVAGRRRACAEGGCSDRGLSLSRAIVWVAALLWMIALLLPHLVSSR